jgi:hypothetical protein
MKFSVAAIALGLAASASAVDLDATRIIEHIAPESKPGAACKNVEGKRPEDCRNSVQVGPLAVKAMYSHGVYELGPMAAVLSNMIHESGAFKYKRNLRETPGQGTANMQMGGFNLEYAKSLPQIRDQFKDFDTVESMTPEDLVKMLDVITDDEYNFGTGPWYYTHHCTAEQKAKFKVSADDGFDAFMECLGVPLPAEDARVKRWNLAKEAFGLQ